MTQFLQSIIGNKQDEKFFNAGLTQLEKMTGNSGVDTRLIADIIEKSHKIMKKLGLDIRDTTAHELYFALNSVVKHDKAESLLGEADYILILIDNKLISFNLIDAIENAHHELSFEKRIFSHGQRSLRGEIVSRYINHARTNDETTMDISKRIGLLPADDACYTGIKHKNNHGEEL